MNHRSCAVSLLLTWAHAQTSIGMSEIAARSLPPILQARHGDPDRPASSPLALGGIGCRAHRPSIRDGTVRTREARVSLADYARPPGRRLHPDPGWLEADGL